MVYHHYMSISYHAIERVDQRLRKAGWDAPDREALLSFVDEYGRQTDIESEAVRVAVLDDQVGMKYGDESNGDEVWAIYRNRLLITLMLRRSEQPDRNLRCRKVTRLV